jgi:hypothetical protein
VGIVAGILTVTWPTIAGSIGHLIERAANIAPSHIAVAELSTAVVQRTLPFAILAAGVVLAPLALYLAFVDE